MSSNKIWKDSMPITSKVVTAESKEKNIENLSEKTQSVLQESQLNSSEQRSAMENTLQAIENQKEKSSSVLIPDGDVQPQSANQSEPTKAKSNKVWTISKPIIKNTLQVTENLKEKSSSVLIPDGDVQQQSANQSEPKKAKSVCFVCAKSFSSKKFMNDHIRKQHGNGSYYRKCQTLCRICNKYFKSQFILSCHRKYAHGISLTDFDINIK